MLPENTVPAADRLDSWKAVADYLARDVATVRRWEKSAGLPIRRVSGGRGHSVFAYRSEIDAWLKKGNTSVVLPTSPEPEAPRRSPVWRIATVVSTVLLVLVTLSWRARTSRADELPAHISVTESAIVAAGPDGVERWRHSFPNTDLFGINSYRPNAETLHGPPPGILVGSAQRFMRGSDLFKSGQLLLFSPSGTLRETFTFDDRLTFVKDTYEGPWSITDFRIEPTNAPEAIAVATHHFQWWPSIVTILDSHWRRRGTFVNAGWIEYLHWAAPNRLVIAGFSNPRDAGMIALLDANAPDGQTPTTEGTPFGCLSCGASGPIRYIVFPRSEVNRVTASPFNRVVLQVMPDRLFARTVEMPAEYPSRARGIVDVLYELSPSLDLLRASYSDLYWDMHRALEMQGKITHTREQCPDRDGPRTYEVWDRYHGWTTRIIEHR